MKSQSEDYGAVVGWSSTTVGDRVTLHVQSVAKPPPFSKDDVKTQIYLMDRNQAMQLANYLFEMGDTTSPRRSDRSLLKRLFG
ncbi:hypothetical protein CP97_13440 [Aurantiacibacter atlanticus]|uniref:Uncharacterized protein n=1 Tax=Aurantiacibacter atlanticus TaxID=1648404 RepID=A0A0H4VIX0_9SPHN|nr:hypothetical protein [Aurantiacibacter atlanticus]AKQ42816.1 hypothetical protein CP97_13440 [Aurantiacibacter atlanticus]MDF1835954.1 hypothetical protein [Alteraurantiacibacter sp. bin_em_oilr2.035]